MFLFRDGNFQQKLTVKSRFVSVTFRIGFRLSILSAARRPRFEGRNTNTETMISRPTQHLNGRRSLDTYALLTTYLLLTYQLLINYVLVAYYLLSSYIVVT